MDTYTVDTQKVDDLTIGLAGEHLVCADLLTHGIPAFTTSRNCQFDVAAHVNGRLVRIQVKTCRQARILPQKKLRDRQVMGYHFSLRQGKKGKRAYSEDAFDILAAVALDTKKIAYLDKSYMPQCLQFLVSGHLKENPKRFEDFPLKKLFSLPRNA